MWIFSTITVSWHVTIHTIRRLRVIPFPASGGEAVNQAAVCKSARKAVCKTAQKAAENTCKAANPKTKEETKRQSLFCRAAPAGVCIAVAATLLFIHHGIGGAFFCGSCSPARWTAYRDFHRHEGLLLWRRRTITPQRKTSFSSRLTTSKAPTLAMTITMTLTVSGTTPWVPSYHRPLQICHRQRCAHGRAKSRLCHAAHFDADARRKEPSHRKQADLKQGNDYRGSTTSTIYPQRSWRTSPFPRLRRNFNATAWNVPRLSGNKRKQTADFRRRLPDMGASEDLSGVQLVNGTRPATPPL